MPVVRALLTPALALFGCLAAACAESGVAQAGTAAAFRRQADWRVTVGGVPVSLETVDISIRENNEPVEHKRLKGDWFQFGSFTLDKPVEVRVACDRPLTALEILPRKFEVRPVAVASNEIAFVATRPFRLAFRPEGRIGALHLFANAPERACPARAVRRLGAGVHILTNICVRSNQTLVLDEGARVFGHLDVRGTNITICGSGIVSGARFARHKGPLPYSNAILNATNVTIRGITFTDPYTWTVGVRRSRNVLFDNVKVMGGRMINDDGIDVVNSSDVTIRNSFIRTQDDNICAKGLGYVKPGVPFAPVENLLVEGCELWTDQANNFRFGFECDAAYMRNIRIRDVDILAASPIALPFKALWCHAVFKAQAGGDLEISGLDVRDVRVHADGNDVCLVYLQPHKTWSHRGKGRYRYTKSGTIRDCRFANIDVYGRQEGFTGWIYLNGPSPAESVSNVTFEAVRYFGRPITLESPCVQISGSVRNVSASAVARTVSADFPAGWAPYLAVPEKYAAFARSVEKESVFPQRDFDVEVYRQANGPGTHQRVMMAVPHGVTGARPCVIVPFYFPEAMLGYDPQTGTNLVKYAGISYMADLARRGYITLSADAYHLTYATNGAPCNAWAKWRHAGEALQRDWPAWTGMGKLLFDTRLLIDLAVADARVDAARIGIIGHSLGGKMAFYAGCLDERVKAIVASDFGIGWTQTNWQDVWYFGSRVDAMRAAGLSHADLLSFAHGKPVCLIAGKYDDADSGAILFAAQGYAAHDDRRSFIRHGTGHRPPAYATQLGYAFLDTWLRHRP